MFEDDIKTEPIILQYGIAEKSYFDMTDEERIRAAAVAFERAKEAAFNPAIKAPYTS